MITDLIRTNIENRAIALFHERTVELTGREWSWEAANETTKNRWRIRAWMEQLRSANGLSRTVVSEQ